MARESGESAVKKQVALLRKGYDIGVYPEYVPLVCNECDSENLKFSVVNETGYEQISLTRLGIPEPFHRASILGFNSPNGPEWFIVDPSYGQFFENVMFRNYMKNNYPDFSNSLLKQGYVRCTMDNVRSYFDGFIYSKAFCKKIDSDKVYDKVGDLLVGSGIIHPDEFDEAMRRRELMEMSSGNSKTGKPNSRKK